MKTNASRFARYSLSAIAGVLVSFPVLAPFAGRSVPHIHETHEQGPGLVRLWKSTQSGLKDPLRTVIRDSVAFRAIWQRAHQHMGVPPASPPVDFRNHIVIVAAMGMLPVLDGEIRIESIDSTGALIRVLLSLTGSATDCILGALAGNPVDIVQIPRTSLGKRFTFIERYEALPCEP